MIRSNKALICIEITFLVVVIWLFLNRLIRGVDTTDEAFYLTMAYRLVQGNMPFKDMWESVTTCALFPGLILKIYCSLTQNTDGAILFFRIAFFTINILASVVIFFGCEKNFGKKVAILLSVFYLIYAPFQLYSLSYNNLANLFFLVCVYLSLLGIERQSKKCFLGAGFACAMLVLSYPTMIFLCAFYLGILLFNRSYKIAWKYYVVGGLGCAVLVTGILVSMIGLNGIIDGIQNILSDPAYGSKGISLFNSLQDILLYFFEPFKNGNVFLICFAVWIVFVIVFKKKWPMLKVSVAIYPVIAYVSLKYLRQGTYSYINYIFLWAVISPLLLFLLLEKKKIVTKYMWYEWLPCMLYYIILSLSTAGGQYQAVHGLTVMALVSLKSMVLLVREGAQSIPVLVKKKDITQWIVIGVLCVTIVFELVVYYNVVYRDLEVQQLKYRVESGPYKGLYTTEGRKQYLEEVDKVLGDMEEAGESCMVLWHSNFAYLMLDMVPTAPTVWGLYNHIDNQDAYINYMLAEESHIPEYIYIVDVPDEFDYDYQDSQYYQHYTKITSLLDRNYELVEEVTIHQTGKIQKYSISQEKSLVFVKNGEGIYSTEYSVDLNSCWNWCEDKATLKLLSTKEDVVVHFSANVRTLQENNKELLIKSKDFEKSYVIGAAPTKVEFDIVLKKGENEIELFSNTSDINVSGDARNLHICLENILIEVK